MAAAWACFSGSSPVNRRTRTSVSTKGSLIGCLSVCCQTVLPGDRSHLLPRQRRGKRACRSAQRRNVGVAGSAQTHLALGVDNECDLVVGLDAEVSTDLGRYRYLPFGGDCRDDLLVHAAPSW